MTHAPDLEGHIGALVVRHHDAALADRERPICSPPGEDDHIVAHGNVGSS